MNNERALVPYDDSKRAIVPTIPPRPTSPQPSRPAPFAPASNRAAQLSSAADDYKKRCLEIFLSKCEWKIPNINPNKEFKDFCGALRFAYYDKNDNEDWVSDGNIFYLPAFGEGGQATVVHRAWHKLDGQATRNTITCPTALPPRPMERAS